MNLDQATLEGGVFILAGPVVAADGDQLSLKVGAEDAGFQVALNASERPALEGAVDVNVAVGHDFGTGADLSHHDEIAAGGVNFLAGADRLVYHLGDGHRLAGRWQRPAGLRLGFGRRTFGSHLGQNGELFVLGRLLLLEAAAPHSDGCQRKPVNGLQELGEIELVLVGLREITEIEDDGGVPEEFRGLAELLFELGGDGLKARAQDLQDRKRNGPGFEFNRGGRRRRGGCIFGHRRLDPGRDNLTSILPFASKMNMTPDGMGEVLGPDFSEGIVNLMQSLIVGLGGQPGAAGPLPALPPEEVAAYKQVVLLVVDGLGIAQLRRLSPEGLLSRHVRSPIRSVFPSTTATAITSLMTGCFPKEHGLTGWHMYFRELGTVMSVLPGKPRYGGVPWGPSGIDVGHLLGLRPIFDRLPVASRLIAPRSIANSPFNRAVRGRGSVDAFTQLDDFFGRLEASIRGTTEKRYHYAYWSEFDHIAHERGYQSVEAEGHLRAFENALSAFLERIQGTSTLLVVTADHGFIDHDPEAVTDLWNYPDIEECLVLPLSGESRAAYAYLRSGREALFERLVAEQLSGRVEIRRSEDLLKEGWFGEGPLHPKFRDRIGDYVLLPQGRGIVRDAVFAERKSAMIGYHGGMSSEEMWVPLAVMNP